MAVSAVWIRVYFLAPSPSEPKEQNAAHRRDALCPSTKIQKQAAFGINPRWFSILFQLAEVVCCQLPSRVLTARDLEAGRRNGEVHKACAGVGGSGCEFFANTVAGLFILSEEEHVTASAGSEEFDAVGVVFHGRGN